MVAGLALLKFKQENASSDDLLSGRREVPRALYTNTASGKSQLKHN
jgi:hypothetical protein